MRLFRFAALLAIGLTLGCQPAPPPTKATSSGPPSASTDTPKAKPAIPDVMPRYLAQIKREFAVIWRRDGRYPATVDEVNAALTWMPKHDNERPLRLFAEGTDMTKERKVIWYVAPDAAGTGAHLRYWAPSQTSVDDGVVIDGLDASYDLAAKDPSDMDKLIDLAAMQAAGTDADTLLRAMLIAKQPVEAGRAASAHYSLTALLEWVLQLREGVFPENESELWGMGLGQPGTVQGLEMFIDRENKKVYSRFTLTGMDPWLVETQFQQPPNTQKWIALSFTIDAKTPLTGSLWRIM